MEAYSKLYEQYSDQLEVDDYGNIFIKEGKEEEFNLEDVTIQESIQEAVKESVIEIVKEELGIDVDVDITIDSNTNEIIVKPGSLPNNPTTLPSEQPTIPNNPSEPTIPTEPITPDKPNEPTIPTEPITPDKPNEPISNKRRSVPSNSYPRYNVNVHLGEGGTIELNTKYTTKGTTVKITVKPDKNYILDNISVSDKNGKALETVYKSNNLYQFIMPDGDVDIVATFK